MAAGALKSFAMEQRPVLQSGVPAGAARGKRDASIF